ncbi:hypothetical protein P7C73_g3168, partial [Tremellales sp. Uapishka_1]
MPPHTISPSVSSQGLGISSSTLSPATASHPQPVSFTGMGVGPRSTAPTTTLFQPTFSLRPTHKRGSSKTGFASFSAIPPSPGSRPMGPRAADRSSLASVAMSPHVDSEHASVEAPSFSEASHHIPPVRQASIASSATSSRGAPRRSRSTELLRRISSIGGNNETVSGGKYQPLGDRDAEPGYPLEPPLHRPQTAEVPRQTHSTYSHAESQSGSGEYDPTPTSTASATFPPHMF